MTNKSYYLLVSIFGVFVMGFGQFMARPQFYGTIFGRSWAHVFWLGFLVFLVPFVILFVRYIARHKSKLLRNAGRDQLVGVLVITGIVGFLTLLSALLGNERLIEADGNARRGVFVVWLLLIILFTMTNLLKLLIQYRLLRVGTSRL